MAIEEPIEKKGEKRWRRRFSALEIIEKKQRKNDGDEKRKPKPNLVGRSNRHAVLITRLMPS